MRNTINPFRLWLLVGLLISSISLSAKTISGTVTDQTGETIISASVIVKGTTIGTVTDFDGNYTLDVPDDATTLVFSYIGLETQEVAISGSVINVVLKENSEVLDEVVVTGYGTTKKRDLVTSVASVSADQLKDIPVTTAAEALQGKLAGVTVTTTEGSPDADVKIRVRGGTSLTQSSDPLYIVDGFPVSSISDIAPSDIQSMDVLKDAAATAIYGAQGANGVIIITTKDVKADDDKMRFHVDYTGYMGWRQMAKRYDMLNQEEFCKMQYEWVNMVKPAQMANRFYKYFDPKFDNSGAYVGDINDIIDTWNQEGATDWQDKTFGKHGLNSNHAFTVSGGNKAATFSLSYNRVDDKGIMYGSEFARNNVSFKGKFVPVKGLTIGTQVRYTNTNVLGSGTNTQDDKGSTSESRVRNALAYTPIALKDRTAQETDDEETIGSMYDPITTIHDNYQKKVENKYNLQAYVQYKFLKHFTVRSEIGYESRNVLTDRYYGPTTYWSRSGVTAYTSPKMGNTNSVDARSSKLRNTNSFEWSQKFDKIHDIKLLVAEEMIIGKGETRTTYGYGFDTKYDGSTVFNHLGAAEAYTMTNYVNPNDNMLSAIGRFDYNYRGKYYLTLTFRADCSTKFARGHQWGYFPSGAFAWRIIDEEFMAPAQEFMSNLKVRATYGLVGNNNIQLGYIHPEYLSYQATNSGMGLNQMYMGQGKAIAPNENLKWETTTSRNLGLDFGFWNERLSGTIDGYCNTTRDLLLLKRLPDGGYNYQYQNVGSTRNMGVEFSLNGIILDHKSKDLSYSLNAGFNLSHNRNVVTDLGGMTEYNVSAGCFSAGYDNSDYEYQLHIGEMVGNIYGYQTEGIYRASDFDGFAANESYYSGGTWTLGGQPIKQLDMNAYPGMIKIKDQNGDGVIDSRDRVVLGCTQAKLNGGFNLGFNIGGEKWGKFDLAMNFTFSVGNKVLNLTALDMESIIERSVMRNNPARIADRYTYLDDANNYIPQTITDFAALAIALDERNEGRTSPTPVMSKFALTDRYVEDASFLRLGSLTIGYQIPRTWMQKAHMQNCRIFFSASNVFCVTPYSGQDPEVDTRSKSNPLASGVDYSAFPKNRTFNFGLNLSF